MIFLVKTEVRTTARDASLDFPRSLIAGWLNLTCTRLRLVETDLQPAGIQCTCRCTLRDVLFSATRHLNTGYYSAPVGNPLARLNDSNLLLERMHGVAHLTREAIQLSPCVDMRSLTLALQAVETFMEMSAGATETAHARFEEIGGDWIASHWGVGRNGDQNDCDLYVHRSIQMLQKAVPGLFH